MRRSKLQRELDLKKISELKLKNKQISQEEIAQKLGITQQQVSKDFNTLTNRWKNDGNLNIDAYKYEALETMKLVQSESWNAWDRSKDDKTKKQLKNKDGTGDKKAGNEKVLSTENSSGDPKFLDLIITTTRETLKIVGGYAPIKQKNEHVFEPIEINYISPMDCSIEDSIDDGFDD